MDILERLRQTPSLSYPASIINYDRICEKGPLWDNVNIWVRDKTANSRNRRLLHHWNILGIPYLPAKFETCAVFLHLKQGPNSFTASVDLAVYEVDQKR